MANWRKHAEALNAVEGSSSGSWKRRIAVALGKTAGSGSWARRIVDSKINGNSSWDRAAEKTIRTDE